MRWSILYVLVAAISCVIGFVGAFSNTNAKVSQATAYGQFVTLLIQHCSIGNLTTVNACSASSGTPCHVKVGSLTSNAFSTNDGTFYSDPKFRIF